MTPNEKLALKIKVKQKKNPLNHSTLLHLIKAYKFIAYLLKTYFVSDKGDHV